MSNPFELNDDKYKKNRSGLGLDPIQSYTTDGSIEDEVADYEQEIEKYLQKSLESTGRSKQQLESSEELAASTARNLLEQREKLERAEKNLEEIHHTTQMTQRSLNSLKSVFGGFFKNKFSRNPAPPNKEDANGPKVVDNKLNKTVESLSNSDYSNGTTSRPTLNETSRTAIKGTRWEVMDNEIDDNLGVMSSQLSRLRMMGSALGDEIQDQNSLLDRIQQKTDRNDSVVRHQDNQMKSLLGYKN